ncbi:MAG TPA: hypothetical protein VL025_03390, partial [Thermoanaerobaculia bacterium]|nr:hypothetical protein [Thermoanaerobaculia bacterium]
MVFPAFQDGSGVELWASNGTPAGTLLLRDSVPGPESVQFRLLGTVGQTALFLGEHGFRERFQLWRSNGTIAGTFPLTDSAAGGPSMCFNLLRSAVVGNLLFFTAAAPGSGCGLWKTDGTVAGTRLVLDTPSGSVGGPEQLTSAGSRLFFFSGQTLWASDGTEAGTREIQTFDFNPHPPWGLTRAGSRVFFLASERDSGEEELWTSDGTVAGTRAVTDFFEPQPFLPESYDSLLGLIGGTFYFLANDGTGFDLWRTDGNASEVRRVTDFVTSQPFPERFDATQLARLGNLLVFQAREDSGAWHLWVSGGTPETTREITDCPGGCPDVFTELIQVGNRIVLTGTDPDGEEIWVTDGTGAGTRRITDLCSGACRSIFSGLFLRLGKVFFIGPGSSGSLAVWTTDGTVAGTVRLADLGTSPFNFSSAFSPVTAGTKVFFAADPGNQGAQLWVSDGTPAGTRQVSDLGSDPGSQPVWFTPFAGGVLFNAYGGSERHLWRSQGTAASTVEIHASGEPTFPPVVSGGLAWFLRKEAPSVGSTQVWRTDGAENGTIRVSSVGPEPLDVLVPFREGAVYLTRAEG